MSKEDRMNMIEEAFEDWNFLVNDGSTVTEARIKVENDYFLTDSETIKLRLLILAEIERKFETGGILWN
ncbi:MAG: hypothetical protein L0J35_00535 [Tetragenococcus halophilus]|nr:hypothetical protein [Tetragenococcus halophilus]